MSLKSLWTLWEKVLSLGPNCSLIKVYKFLSRSVVIMSTVLSFEIKAEKNAWKPHFDTNNILLNPVFYIKREYKRTKSWANSIQFGPLFLKSTPLSLPTLLLKLREPIRYYRMQDKILLLREVSHFFVIFETLWLWYNFWRDCVPLVRACSWPPSYSWRNRRDWFLDGDFQSLDSNKNDIPLCQKLVNWWVGSFRYCNIPLLLQICLLR